VTSFIGFQERKNSTWRVYNFTNPGTKDPAVLRARVIAGQSGSPAPILIKHDMKTPHSIQMSAGVGHQFTSELGVNIDYVRQHMDNLYVQRNPNYLDKTVTPNRRKLTASYGDIVLWDDIGQSDFSAILLQSTWQRRQTRFNLAYTLGWYEGDFDTAAAELRLPIPVQPGSASGDDASRRPVTSQADSVRVHALVDHHDRRARVVRRSTVATSTSTTSPAMTTSAARRPRPSRPPRRCRLNRNWYSHGRRPLGAPSTRNGRKISAPAEVFNLFNWSNNLSRQRAVHAPAQCLIWRAYGVFRRGRRSSGRVDW
jgi:hypothetical protein